MDTLKMLTFLWYSIQVKDPSNLYPADVNVKDAANSLI